MAWGAGFKLTRTPSAGPKSSGRVGAARRSVKLSRRPWGGRRSSRSRNPRSCSPRRGSRSLPLCVSGPVLGLRVCALPPARAHAGPRANSDKSPRIESFSESLTAASLATQSEITNPACKNSSMGRWWAGWFHKLNSSRWRSAIGIGSDNRLELVASIVGLTNRVRNSFRSNLLKSAFFSLSSR